MPVLAGLRRAVPRMAAGPNLAPTHPPGALGVSAPRPRRWRCRATGSARATACPFTPTSSTRGPTRRLSCRTRTPRDATAAGLTCRRPSPACGAAQRALLSVGHASCCRSDTPAPVAALIAGPPATLVADRRGQRHTAPVLVGQGQGLQACASQEASALDWEGRLAGVRRPCRWGLPAEPGGRRQLVAGLIVRCAVPRQAVPAL